MTVEKVFRGIGVVAAGFIALFFLTVVSYVVWPDVRDYVAPHPFTPENWDQAGYLSLDPEYSRWRMRHSLTRQYELIGMSRAEVEALLGQGDADRDLYYNLGPTGHGIDFGVLELRLNEAGEVEWYEFRGH